MGESPKPSIRITSRDLDVLQDLGSYRFLSVPQLAALCFPSNGSAEERMRALFRAGFATRVFLAARPYDRSVSTIYALSRRGAELLAERHEGKRPPHLTGAQQRSALFLDHTLRRNDVRICLELLDRDTPLFHLLCWKQSPEEVRGSAVIQVGRRQERVPIVPDGFFAVRYRSEVTSFCLEVDMGTVNTDKMFRRYRAYWRWWREGGAARRFGQAPLRVLTMTTTEPRLERLRRLAMIAPETGMRGSGLFWFSHLSVALIHEPQKLIGSCWTAAVPSGSTPRPLLE